MALPAIGLCGLGVEEVERCFEEAKVLRRREVVTPAEHEQPSVREGFRQRVSRPCEVLLAQHDEDGARDGGERVWGEPRFGPAEACRQRLGVIAGSTCGCGEEPGHRVIGVDITFDGTGNWLGIPAPEQVGAHTADDDLAEPLRVAGGDAEQDPGTEGEADGVEFTLWGHRGLNAGLEVGICGGIVRFVGLAVSEQVRADDFTPGFGEQIGESGVPPVPLE